MQLKKSPPPFTQPIKMQDSSQQQENDSHFGLLISIPC